MAYTFEEWRASAERVADLQAERPGIDATGAGLIYRDGAWIEGPDEAGRYFTLAGNADVQSTLAECEAFLWEHHSRFEAR
jgi:hypothetical protein